MNKLDKFIEKNYNKIVKWLKREGEDLGYKKNELQGYFEDTKCFIFAGTMEELKANAKTPKDYSIISQEDELVIAEFFTGITFNCI